MSEFIFSDGIQNEITIRSGNPFLSIEVDLDKSTYAYFDLEIEQAKNLVLFLNEKIALAEKTK